MKRLQMEFLEPWESEASSAFLDELNKEISDKHILKGTKLTVVARRIDRDDVLFQYQDIPDKYVQVHLTWKSNEESDAKWPKTKIYDALEEWVNEVMLQDNKEYEEN